MVFHTTLFSHAVLCHRATLFPEVAIISHPFRHFFPHPTPTLPGLISTHQLHKFKFMCSKLLSSQRTSPLLLIPFRGAVSLSGPIPSHPMIFIGKTSMTNEALALSSLSMPEAHHYDSLWVHRNFRITTHKPP